MNRNDVWSGALIADAAAMGLHWLYDQEQILRIQATGSLLFRQPDAAQYLDRRGYFAHAARRSGELSHYGESARIVGVLAANDLWSPASHQQRFLEVFGPCGSFVGYADRPTKALVARILSEGEELPAVSGMDDNQFPALCVVAGLFAAGATRDDVLSAARVISTHDDVIKGAAAVFDCLTLIVDGIPLNEALAKSASATEGELGSRLQEALALSETNPQVMARHFGLACYVSDGLPVVWNLLGHAGDFSAALESNILCGGDSCGRSMVLGAIAGLVFGIPMSLLTRVTEEVRFDLARTVE